jgi:5-methylcytosine-specific restriction enzyme A
MQYTVNVFDIEEALISLGGEAKTQDIQDQVLRVYCSGVVPENYKDKRTFRQTIQRKLEDHCPQAAGFDLTKNAPKFIRIDHGLYRHEVGSNHKEFMAIEEIEEIDGLLEGAVKAIFVNAYERNPEARRECIRHHGWACKVCGFDFKMAYGELGRDFIHVHHIKPLSEIKSTYRVNPKKDLVPLCANCHAMIHRAVPPISVEQLRENYNFRPNYDNRTNERSSRTP